MKKEHERSLPLALPDDYLLPYGTELSPSSFTKTMDNTYIVDALDSHGNPAHYEIAVNGNLAKCTIDGEAASYENPYSHRDTGAEAPIFDWFDWIASQDAAGHRYLDSDIYGGQTVAAKLFCAEHNLVTYSSTKCCVSNFSTLSEFQEWLDSSVLQETPMRAEVVGLLTDPEQARKPFSYAFDLLDAIEGPDAVSELKLATAGEKDCGLRLTSANFGGNEILLEDGRTMGRTVSMVKACYDDGTQPTWMHAIGFVPKTYLPEMNVRVVHENDAAWWGILVDQLDVCLVLPRPSAERQLDTNVKVHMDRDGTEAFIRFSPTDECELVNRLDDRFKRKWGRWLDSSIVLDNREIQDAVTHMESILDKEYGGRTA